MSYREVAKQQGIRNKTHVLIWVKSLLEGQVLEQETEDQVCEYGIRNGLIVYGDCLPKKAMSKSTRGVTSKQRKSISPLLKLSLN